MVIILTLVPIFFWFDANIEDEGTATNGVMVVLNADYFPQALECFNKGLFVIPGAIINGATSSCSNSV